MLQLKQLLPSNTKRKQRTVKNADVDVNDVLVPPGHRYVNWINVTKRKLIERESKVMNRRVVIIQNIINEEMESFKTNIIDKYVSNVNINPKLFSNIMLDHYDLFKICLNKLSQYVNKWNGVSLVHMKRKISTYRDYFAIGKSWFDQRKKRILATDLWIVVFDIIQQMSATIGMCFQEPILQQTLSKSIFLQVTFRIFEAKVTSPASRPHHLLNQSILKDSTQFKKYLAKHFIDIKEHELKKQYKKITAQIIRKHVVKQLELLSNQSKKQFINQLNEYYSSTNMNTNTNPNILNHYDNSDCSVSLNMDESAQFINQLTKYYTPPPSININTSNSNNSNMNDSVQSSLQSTVSNNAFDDYNVTLHAEGIIFDLGLPIPSDVIVPYNEIDTLQIPNGMPAISNTYNGFHCATYSALDQRFQPM